MKIAILTIDYLEKEVREFRCQHKSTNFLSAKYPLNLLECHSYIKKEFKNQIKKIDIFDGNVEKIEIKKIKEYDYLLIFSSQNTLKKDLTWIKEKKEILNKNTKILLIGPTVQYFENEINIKFPNLIDFIPKNPYMKSTITYLKKKETNEKTLKKPDVKKQIKEELNEFAKIKYDYSKINTQKYYIKLGFKKKYFAEIVTGKGCYNNCNFCIVPFIYQNQVIKRDIDNIITEIKYFTSKKIKYIHFFDEDFLNDLDFVRKLLNKIIEKKIKITFSCSARINELNNLEILTLLKKAGCISISIGIESFSEEVLKQMNKIRDTKKDLEIIKTASKYILIHGHFILGYEKNIEELEKTKKNILKSELSLIGLYTITPFPNTALFENIKKNTDFETIEKRNYESKKGLYLNIDINKYKQKLYIKFYSPKRILKLIITYIKQL